MIMRTIGGPACKISLVNNREVVLNAVDWYYRGGTSCLEWEHGASHVGIVFDKTGNVVQARIC